MLLKLRKTVGDVTVCNVNPEVYEIFDVTGFTSILNVKKAYKEIDLTGKPIIGQGGNGTVYRLDDERIVKVYRSEHSIEYIEHEQQYAKAAFVSVIPWTGVCVQCGYAAPFCDTERRSRAADHQ